jgi:hypothetical protein
MTSAIRKKICQESKEGLKVATNAAITSKNGTGYSIKMSNQHGSAWVEFGKGKIAVYETISACERTIKRHNATIKITRPKASPPAAMCPPNK